MDAGHHNCRDYHLKPEDTSSKPYSPPTTASILASRAARIRVSQKSPLNDTSRKEPPFPFLQLPLEIRRQVYHYLLPRTEVQNETRQLFENLISANRIPPTHTNLPPDVLKQLLAKYTTTTPGPAKDKVIWRRGQTSLLAVCHQLHAECAHLLYGENTFVVFVTYDKITFRFRWFLPWGLCPNTTPDFLDLIPPKYLKLIKRLIVTVDHVDSYTGEIKYNVGGKGLTHGLRSQVAKLTQALTSIDNEEQGLRRLTLRLHNGNDHLDAEKRNAIKAKEPSIRGVEEVQTVLEPLQALKGLVHLDVTGSVTDDFVEQLRGFTMAS